MGGIASASGRTDARGIVDGGGDEDGGDEDGGDEVGADEDGGGGDVSGGGASLVAEMSAVDDSSDSSAAHPAADAIDRANNNDKRLVQHLTERRSPDPDMQRPPWRTATP